MRPTAGICAISGNRRRALWTVGAAGALAAGALVAAPAGPVGAAPADPTAADAPLHAMGSWQRGAVSSRVTSDGQATSWEEQGVSGRRGVDVSYWDHQGPGTLNFAKLRTVGVEFAFIKASEFMNGREGYDRYSYYAQDKAAANAAGVITGAYQYANPTSNPSRIVEDAAAQARGLVAKIGGVGPGELPPVLDLENSETSLGPANLSLWASTWMDTVESLTGREPILYSYTNYLATRLSPTRGVTKRPLWQAHYYYRISEPGAVSGWPRGNRMFWQFSSKGRPPGTGGAHTDLDVFLGTDADYQRLTQASSLQPAFSPQRRGPAAAEASLARIESALQRMSLRRGRAYRSARLAAHARAGMLARGVTGRDLRYSGQYRLGKRNATTVWLRATYDGGAICSVAPARTPGAHWTRTPCPRSARIWSGI